MASARPVFSRRQAETTRAERKALGFRLTFAAAPGAGRQPDRVSSGDLPRLVDEFAGPEFKRPQNPHAVSGKLEIRFIGAQVTCQLPSEAR